VFLSLNIGYSVTQVSLFILIIYHTVCQLLILHDRRSAMQEVVQL